MHQPYIGIVEGRKIKHPLLIIENCSRLKIMLLDATGDIPVKTIDRILQLAIDLYQSNNPGTLIHRLAGSAINLYLQINKIH